MIEQRFCTNCGVGIEAGSSFCSSCGHAAGDATAVTGATYAGFWIRMAAWLIDGVILFVVQGLVELTPVGLFALLISPVYGVLFIGLKGQTPGKMALGITVVNADGNVPGIGRAIMREIVGKIISTVALLLGYFWIGLDRRKRAWHDYIGGTYLVRKPAVTAVDDAV